MTVNRHILASLTRITDLATTPFTIEALPRQQWRQGDYVAAEVVRTMRTARLVELPKGRLMEVLKGDLVIGAFGNRFATLEAVGSWTDIGEDGRLDLMTSAGLLGRCTSRSTHSPALVPLRYSGHVMVQGQQRAMGDYVTYQEPVPYRMPVVLIIGTSMSAGKTASGRVVVRMLKELGHKVVAAKLTGAGRYRDVLSMGDAGADAIFDFVDVGLPSSVCEPGDYRPALTELLTRMQKTGAGVAVIEAGASPLEPYNGEAAIEMLGDNVRLTILCASDPYAVLGVREAFGRTPDLVAGIASNTEAGIALTRKLTGIESANLLDPRTWEMLRELLQGKLGRRQETG